MSRRGAFYPSLDSYNTDVLAARRAYNTDMCVQDGWCATCGDRKRNQQNRRCRSCITRRRREVVR